MEVTITKRFTKQYLRCPAHIQDAANKVVIALEQAKALNEINNLKKLSGFSNYFRIRIGNYRIGIQEIMPEIIVMCILERSQIYKEFPPDR